MRVPELFLVLIIGVMWVIPLAAAAAVRTHAVMRSSIAGHRQASAAGNVR